MAKSLKDILPDSIKRPIKYVLFRIKYGFPPPPRYTDLTMYQRIIDFLVKHGINKIKGDVVEIGAFLGGGTYKLCKFYEKSSPEKKVYAIDVFDPDFDGTECTRGEKMRDLYDKVLKRFAGKKQLDIFNAVTKSCKNLELIVADSKQAQLPCSKVSFAYVDGNHSVEYVESDFYKIWEKLSPGGVIAFDDYGYDLPTVTGTIHRIISKEIDKIERIYTEGHNTIFIVKQ